jgi:hypothetical protein
LTFTEMALEECVFKGIDAKEKSRPAMMFVMGHTHEPVLQEIVVLASSSAVPPSRPPAYKPGSSSKVNPGARVGVSFRFLHVETVDCSRLGPAFLWNLFATAGPAGTLTSSSEETGTGPIEPKCLLFDDRPIHRGEQIPLPGGQRFDLQVPLDKGVRLEFTVELGHAVDSAFWQDSPHAIERERRVKSVGADGREHEDLVTRWVRPVVFSMEIPALSWSGTRTVEIDESQSLRYRVSFDLVWGPLTR